MPTEARITSIWKKQKFFLAIFLFFIGGWFLRDGISTYPRSNERWLACEKLKADGHPGEWPAMARSRHWNEIPPHKFYSQGDITGQYVIGTLVALIGAIVLLYWSSQKGRVLKSSLEAIHTPCGKTVPFDSILDLDKRKWESKGLATVHYSLNGRKGKFILDDYKFDHEPVRAIFGEIEEKLAARTARDTR